MFGFLSLCKATKPSSVLKNFPQKTDKSIIEKSSQVSLAPLLLPQKMCVKGQKSTASLSLKHVIVII